MTETTLTKETLLTMLANATKTHYCCNGHGKAERNEMKAKQYAEQLTAMNVPVPTDKELLEVGIFNGIGSS